MSRFEGPGEVGLAGDVPGTIRALELTPGEAIIVQQGGFLAAEPSVEFQIALVKRLKVSVLGRENLVLQRLSGQGVAFIHAAGDFVEFNLDSGERLEADTGSMVCFDASVDYDMRWSGTVGTSLLGGEGIFLSSFTGPGRVLLSDNGPRGVKSSTGGQIG